MKDSDVQEKMYSHVIGADGKWSTVRKAAAVLEHERTGVTPKRGFPEASVVQYEPAWRVQMLMQEESLPEGVELLEVIRPRNLLPCQLSFV